MAFAGDVKSPLWVGKAGDIPNIVDNEFWYMLELWRWWKMGAYKIDLDSDMREALGIRAIEECS